MFSRDKKSDLSDACVINAFKTCDETVQFRWYDHCREKMDRVTKKWLGITDSDRDDLFQMSMTLLWRKIEDGGIFCMGTTVYARTRRGTTAIESLEGFFMKIVKNYYYELIRQHGRMIGIDDIGVQFPDESDSIYDSDTEVTKDMIVGECLMRLPKSCLEILIMFYHEGKTLEEILQSRPENTSYNGLKTRKSKCLANLKSMVTEAFNKAGLKP